jgi:hypothetical protein
MLRGPSARKRSKSANRSRPGPGGKQELVFLNHTPNGEIIRVYLEGIDPTTLRDADRQFEEEAARLSGGWETIALTYHDARTAGTAAIT